MNEVSDDVNIKGFSNKELLKFYQRQHFRYVDATRGQRDYEERLRLAVTIGRAGDEILKRMDSARKS